MFYLFKKRQDVFLQNLKIAFPNLTQSKRKRLMKKSYHHFARAGFEFFMLCPENWKKISKRISVTGEDALKSALDEKKGVILATGHFGCWEILGYYLGMKNYSFSAIGRRQKNVFWDKFFKDIRAACGLVQIDHDAPNQQFTDVLESGGILGLVSDQDAGRKGFFVPFFGKNASTPKGTAVYHKRYGSPIVLGFCVRNCSKFEIHFERLETKNTDSHEEITAHFTQKIEDVVQQYPEQYFWFHRRWKSL